MVSTKDIILFRPYGIDDAFIITQSKGFATTIESLMAIMFSESLQKLN